MPDERNLTLIVTPQYQGYLMADIRRLLSPRRFVAFTDWFAGQTGVIHNGELLVYRHDYDAWLKGERNAD